MSNSNNIPITWDSEHDNNLLGSLFPQGINSSGFEAVQTKVNNHSWKYLKKSSVEVAMDFKVAFPFTSKNLTLIQETNCPCEIKPEEIVVFYESGKKEGYQKGDDEYLFKIKIFSSTRGTSVEKAYYNCKVEEDEALFFIENNSGDVSSAKIFAKFGAKVQKELLLKLDNKSDFYKSISKIPNIDKNVIKELIQNGVYQADESIIKIFAIGLYKFLSIVGIPAKAVGWLCEKVGEGIIEYLSLPDTVWDSHSEEYFLKRENIINSLTVDISSIKTIRDLLDKDDKKKDFFHLLPDFISEVLELQLFAIERMVKSYNDYIIETINELYDNNTATVLVTDMQYHISEKIALFAGIWNGLVDFVGGLLLFVGQIAQIQYNVGTDLDKFLEQFDEFRESIANFEWSKITDVIKEQYQEIKNYLKNEDDALNYDKVAYFSGYSLAFIATLFIPFTAFAKPLTVINKLKKSLVPTELVEKVSQATVKSGNVVLNNSKKAVEEGIELLNQITNLLSKGIDGVEALLKDIWKKIVEWFKANLKVVKDIEKVDDLLLLYVKILKSNRLYLKALDRVIAKRVLGRWLAIESEAMVKLYTSFIFKGLNEALRSGKKLSKEFEAMRKILDDALERLPISPYNKNTVLQRSVFFSEKEIKKLFVVGKDFVEKGFMSTTHSEEALFRWMRKNPEHNVIFKVYGKNGKLIEKTAYDATENEVLFKSGTNFLVNGISKIKHPIQSRARNGEKVFQIILKEK